uniref:Uncharacterized protein n=1 Tax=Ursus maritimus TaxID=29073 RepID=A0A452T7Q2_URSMA
MAWASRPIFWELVMRSSPRNRSRGLNTWARYSRTTYRCTSCRVSWAVRQQGQGPSWWPQPRARFHQSPVPLRYLSPQWGHVLQMAGEGHHLVHEGLQHVLCQPGLGAQDPEKRLGAEGDRSLPTASSTPPDPLLRAQCLAPHRGVSGQGTPCPQEEILEGLTPF